LKILAVDTSQKTMTVVFYDGEHNFCRTVEGEKNHSSLLLPAIDQILQAAGVPLNGIQAFCIVTGPGSFTGLRVGLATLKGLSFGREIPFYPVNTEELSAYYETGRPEAFYRVLAEKIKSGRGIPAAQVELLYENPETKRFKY